MLYVKCQVLLTTVFVGVENYFRRKTEIHITLSSSANCRGEDKSGNAVGALFMIRQTWNRWTSNVVVKINNGNKISVMLDFCKNITS